MKRTVLITGANGLLGRATQNSFGEAGWNVVALPRTELDIADRDAVLRAIVRVSPSLVVNCAATADVDRCEIEPDWAFSINERGPRNLALGCIEVDAEIVHVSTDYVFDGSKQGFYTQEDQPSPISVYGKAKLSGELAVREITSKSYVMRTSWLFGRGGKNFGSRVIEYARGGAKLKGVIDQISIPSYAPDVSRRIVEIVKLGSHGLYHVTSSGPTSWFDFARLALNLAGLESVEITPVSRADLNQRAPRPQNSAMRCLLSERLGLTPLRHWNETLPGFVSSL